MISLARLLHLLCSTIDKLLLYVTIGFKYLVFASCMLLGLVYLLLVYWNPFEGSCDKAFGISPVVCFP